MAWQRSLHAESDSVQRQLALYGKRWPSASTATAPLPEVLALDAQLQGALRRTLSTDEVAAAQPQAGAGQRRQPVVRPALLNPDGLAVAASNWRSATSNVGQDYSFRPYVEQQALAQGAAVYGIGVTTGVPGYFLSQAIRDDHGHTLGLVVIKIDFAGAGTRMAANA